MRHCSWAAETPGKYERDYKNASFTFAKSKFSLNGKISERIFSNPHPRTTDKFSRHLSNFVPEGPFDSSGNGLVTSSITWTNDKPLYLRYMALLGFNGLTKLMAWIIHHIHGGFLWDVITRPCPDFNTLRPRQNGRRFPDDIFKCISLNENV